MCIEHIKSTSIEGIQFSNALCDSINDQMVSSYIPDKLSPFLIEIIISRSFLLGVGKPPTARIKHWRKPIERLLLLSGKRREKNRRHFLEHQQTNWNCWLTQSSNHIPFWIGNCKTYLLLDFKVCPQYTTIFNECAVFTMFGAGTTPHIGHVH